MTKVEIEMRYRNQSLPVEQRVEDLLSRMDLAEKLAQLRNYCVNAPDAAVFVNGQVDRTSALCFSCRVTAQEVRV